jgi:glycerate kinase
LDETGTELRFENPVNREFVLFGEGEFATITVSDLSGKSFVFPASGSNRFDVSSLPAGLYILTALNDQNVKRRFVKL